MSTAPFSSSGSLLGHKSTEINALRIYLDPKHLFDHDDLWHLKTLDPSSQGYGNELSAEFLLQVHVLVALIVAVARV